MGANGTHATATAADLFGDEIKITTEQRTFLDLMTEFRASMAATLALAQKVEEAGSKIVLGIPLPEKERKPHLIKAVLTHFDKRHREKIHDPVTNEPVPAKIDGAKDSAIVKRLLATYGQDRIEQLIDQFFEMDDDFVTHRTGYTVGAFSGRVASLLSSSALPARVTGATRNTQDNRRHAANAASMIQRTYGGAR